MCTTHGYYLIEWSFNLWHNSCLRALITHRVRGHSFVRLFKRESREPLRYFTAFLVVVVIIAIIVAVVVLVLVVVLTILLIFCSHDMALCWFAVIVLLLLLPKILVLFLIWYRCFSATTWSNAGLLFLASPTLTRCHRDLITTTPLQVRKMMVIKMLMRMIRMMRMRVYHDLNLTNFLSAMLPSPSSAHPHTPLTVVVPGYQHH